MNGHNRQTNDRSVKVLKKLSIKNPKGWDERLLSVLYAYRTKTHCILKVSPFEFLYSVSFPSIRQNPFQMPVRAMDMEILAQI
jgi:hypothetical protein